MGRLSQSGDPDEGTPLLAPLEARIEAALFAAARPVQERELVALLPAGADVRGALARIAAFWEGRGLFLERRPDGWAMAARPELVPPDDPASARRLSKAAGATLMAIAMHQPVTHPQVERIRGVRVARDILESLEASGLIRTVGRRRGSGRAALYEVTEAFLDQCGLERLSDLPTSEEALLLDLVASSPAPAGASPDATLRSRER